eukprot:3935804-Rhodomonas_salina.2
MPRHRLRTSNEHHGLTLRCERLLLLLLLRQHLRAHASQLHVLLLRGVGLLDDAVNLAAVLDAHLIPALHKTKPHINQPAISHTILAPDWQQRLMPMILEQVFYLDSKDLVAESAHSALALRLA